MSASGRSSTSLGLANPYYPSSIREQCLWRIAFTDLGIEQAKSSEVSRSLAKEYLQWQTMRVRQLLDFLQEQVTQEIATQQVVEAYGAEISALPIFHPLCSRRAGSRRRRSLPGPMKWAATDPKESTDAMSRLARRCSKSALPNLLTEQDIGRMQRLLLRFVKLVPREYQNGVHNGELIIPLEYREATQFNDQARTLVNQLAPVWKQEQPQTYQT